MCIRDRHSLAGEGLVLAVGDFAARRGIWLVRSFLRAQVILCLLYTSDAADERSSVDLGGRRIIKKKKQCELRDHRVHQVHKVKCSITFIHATKEMTIKVRHGEKR